jgi:hypothetical protein
MNRILETLVVVVLLSFSSAVFADGDVWYNGSHNFGTSLQAPGNSNFFFGSSTGGPAVFNGSAFTQRGNSQFSGQIGGWASTYVPQGTVGTAQAGGNISYSFNAGHNGAPYSGVNHSVNVWSSSMGTGNANVNIMFDGNASSLVPQPVPVVVINGGKG